jgi:hypothetical protein
VSEHVSNEECVRFVPAAVEGMNDVAEVAIFPDRLEVYVSGTWQVLKYDVAAMRWLWAPINWVFRLLDARTGRALMMVGEREFCTDKRYFLFFTRPKLKIYTPIEHDLPYTETYSFRITQILLRGGYSTYDLS